MKKIKHTFLLIAFIFGVFGTSQCQVVCDDFINVSLDNVGEAEIFGEHLVQQSGQFTEILVSRDNVDFAQSVFFNCDDIDIEYTVYVRAFLGNDESTCTSTVFVEDKIPPTPVLNVPFEITLVDLDDIFVLDPGMIDEGSFDNCSVVTLELSQSIFTADDEGENTVTLTVIDASGNLNSSLTTVIVTIDGIPATCTLDNVIFPEDIAIFDQDYNGGSLSPQALQNDYGYSVEETFPALPADCPNFTISYSDQIINNTAQVKVIRTWSVLDWYTANFIEQNQTITVNFDSGSLNCISGLIIDAVTLPVTLFPQDLLAVSTNGFPYELTITDMNGNVVADNVITPNYIGEELTGTVSLDGNTCWSLITISEGFEECDYTSITEVVSFPLSEITLDDVSSFPSLSPQDIADNSVFEIEDVNVVITGDCPSIATSFNDVVIDQGTGVSFIERTFVVIDWLTYDPVTEVGLWEFVQTIYIGINPTDFICDTEPNTAPVGDCDSGHTLDDDVEWPADISVADYRIDPDELVNISGIAPENAQPIFFNTPDDYTATYTDVIFDLTPTTLLIDRQWVAEHIVYGFTFNYTQRLSVDFTMFSNMVVVETTTGRPFPEVTINNTMSTNDIGIVFTNEDIVSLDFEDSYYNGLNILDLVLMRRYILGQIDDVDDDFKIASDLNDSGGTSTLDFVFVMRKILGVDTQLRWRFFEIEESNELLQPREGFKAIKDGDVDDSAILPGQELPSVQYEFEVDDILINNGESYEIPVRLDREGIVHGIEVKMGIDPSAIEVTDVSSDLFDNVNFNVNEDNELVIVFFDTNVLPANIDEEGTFMTLSFTANSNALLSDVVDFDDKLSYAVSEDYELIVIGGETSNVISTGVNDPEMADLTIYPNPASDFITIDLGNLSIKGTTEVFVFDNLGNNVLATQGETVDIGQLSNGVYQCVIRKGDFQTTRRIIKVD